MSYCRDILSTAASMGSCSASGEKPLRSPQMWNKCSTTFLLPSNKDTILNFSGTRITTYPSLGYIITWTLMCFGTAHRLLWPPMGSARQLRKTSHMSRTLFLGKPLCRWWTSFLSNSSRSCWATRPKTTRHIHFQRVTWLKISAIWFFAMTRYLCNEAWGSLGHRNWSVHVFYL